MVWMYVSLVCVCQDGAFGCLVQEMPLFHELCIGLTCLCAGDGVCVWIGLCTPWAHLRVIWDMCMCMYVSDVVHVCACMCAGLCVQVYVCVCVCVMHIEHRCILVMCMSTRSFCSVFVCMYPWVRVMVDVHSYGWQLKVLTHTHTSLLFEWFCKRLWKPCWDHNIAYLPFRLDVIRTHTRGHYGLPTLDTRVFHTH